MRLTEGTDKEARRVLEISFCCVCSFMMLFGSNVILQEDNLLDKTNSLESNL